MLAECCYGPEETCLCLHETYILWKGTGMVSRNTVKGVSSRVVIQG